MLNLHQLLEKYPAFLTASDLVELGLWPSAQAVFLARKQNKTPNYIKIGQRYKYPKASVIEFINKNIQREVAL